MHTKAWHLAPECYKISKAEFESLMNQDIIRPSSSNWLSALFIVPGDSRPCGDCHPLSSCTMENIYPLPNSIVLFPTPWLHGLLSNRPHYGIPSDSSPSRRYSEDGHYHTFLPFRIRQDALLTKQRGTDVPLLYRWGPSRSAQLHLHRWPLHR